MFNDTVDPFENLDAAAVFSASFRESELTVDLPQQDDCSMRTGPVGEEIVRALDSVY